MVEKKKFYLVIKFSICRLIYQILLLKKILKIIKKKIRIKFYKMNKRYKLQIITFKVKLVNNIYIFI